MKFTKLQTQQSLIDTLKHNRKKCRSKVYMDCRLDRPLHVSKVSPQLQEFLSNAVLRSDKFRLIAGFIQACCLFIRFVGENCKSALLTSERREI